MKQFSTITLSKTELLATVAILLWIVAGCLVPLPDVNSLGY